MFQKKQTQPLRPTIESSMGSTPTFSIFGGDIVVKGDVAASADLHIDGRIEGDVTCATLVQGEASQINGAITADSARLAGTVHGTIHVGDLVVQRGARIHGDVNYDTLTIEQGALVVGRFAQRQPAALAIEGAAKVLENSEKVFFESDSATR